MGVTVTIVTEIAMIAGIIKYLTNMLSLIFNSNYSIFYMEKDRKAIILLLFSIWLYLNLKKQFKKRNMKTNIIVCNAYFFTKLNGCNQNGKIKRYLFSNVNYLEKDFIEFKISNFCLHPKLNSLVIKVLKI